MTRLHGKQYVWKWQVEERLRYEASSDHEELCGLGWGVRMPSRCRKARGFI